MLTIEFEPPYRKDCDCCGGTSTTLTRYVSEDDAAYAVYYASFSDLHPDEVKVVVSLGVWWDGGTPSDRLAFPLVLWQDDENFGVTLVDSAASPWKDVELLGRMLDREEAVTHPKAKEVFHVTDHIVRDDPEVVGFFSRNRIS